jgi:hypothetical protein
MSQPFTEPPKTVSYRVRINSEEWQEFKTAVKAARLVTDNIVVEKDWSAQVEFLDATDLAVVRENFKRRVSERLEELKLVGKVWHEVDDETGGLHFRQEK